MPYPHYHPAHWHRGPSRLLWFFIGAGTATWWIYRKDAHAYHRQGLFGHCRRPQLPPSDNSGTMNPDGSWPTPDSRDVPRSVPGWGVASERPMQWDTPDKEKMAQMSRQAVDTATELTEAALESVLSTAESLKAKLVAHRAEREKQQKSYEQQVENQPVNPPQTV